MVDQYTDQVVIGANLNIPNGAIRDRFGWRTHAGDAVKLAVDDTAGGETSVSSHAAPFNDTAAQSVDLTSATGPNLGANAKSFSGMVTSGHQAIYIPFGQPTSGTPSGQVCSFDLEASSTIDSTVGWSSFDLTSLTASFSAICPRARGYRFGCVDGFGKVYLAPGWGGTGTGSAASGVVAQYDPGVGDIDDPTAWKLFEIPSVVGFCTCSWDGARYVYFAPCDAGAAGTPTYHGNLVRFDTANAAGFTGSASWNTYNLATILSDSSAVGFQSCICANGRF